ncbi:MAG: hypothetical protein LBS33_02290 [Streptococcaceae bacterium]|jgi:hypothetical protein|nr:hypothetical protein [Streptococcaceae bacterium]
MRKFLKSTIILWILSVLFLLTSFSFIPLENIVSFFVCVIIAAWLASRAWRESQRQMPQKTTNTSLSLKLDKIAQALEELKTELKVLISKTTGNTLVNFSPISYDNTIIKSAVIEEQPIEKLCKEAEELRNRLNALTTTPKETDGHILAYVYDNIKVAVIRGEEPNLATCTLCIYKNPSTKGAPLKRLILL